MKTRFSVRFFFRSRPRASAQEDNWRYLQVQGHESKVHSMSSIRFISRNKRPRETLIWPVAMRLLTSVRLRRGRPPLRLFRFVVFSYNIFVERRKWVMNWIKHNLLFVHECKCVERFSGILNIALLLRLLRVCIWACIAETSGERKKKKVMRSAEDEYKIDFCSFLSSLGVESGRAWRRATMRCDISRLTSRKSHCWSLDHRLDGFSNSALFCTSRLQVCRSLAQLKIALYARV